MFKKTILTIKYLQTKVFSRVYASDLVPHTARLSLHSPHISHSSSSALRLPCSKQTVRFLAKEAGKNKNKIQQSEENEESDYEDGDKKEDSDFFNRTFADDKSLPFNFRERRHVMKSTRIDSIISSGLNISKNKVSDLLLGSKIKLNGKKVLKKSVKVQEGDCVDVAMLEENRTGVKRVRVLAVVEEEGRCEVYLRSWKGGIEGVGSLEGGNWK